MKVFNKFRLLWGCIPFFMGLPTQAISACDDSRAGLELDRMLLNKETLNCTNFWASYSFYNQNFNVVEAENNSTTSQLASWTALRGGINYPLAYGLKLRGYIESGNQQGTRVTEPKYVTTDFLGTDLRVQWSTSLFTHQRIGIEAGYRAHKTPNTSYYKLQQGNILATAPPGKSLMDVSAKDNAWFIAGIFHGQITDDFSVHAGVEWRDIEVQATTTSQFPLIQSLLEIQQVPQATPWQEKHVVINLGFDWQVLDKVGLGIDYKKYNIQRFNYQIRDNFIDYNESTQLDFYLGYQAKTPLILFIHARYISNYLLGDTPSLYNRRNNHTFKNPFGFITVGAQF